MFICIIKQYLSNIWSSIKHEQFNQQWGWIEKIHRLLKRWIYIYINIYKYTYMYIHINIYILYNTLYYTLYIICYILYVLYIYILYTNIHIYMDIYTYMYYIYYIYFFIIYIYIYIIYIQGIIQEFNSNTLWCELYSLPYSSYYRIKTVCSCWVWKLSNDACPLNLVPSASFLTQCDWLEKKTAQSLCVRKEALGARMMPTKTMVRHYVIGNA